MPVSSLIDRARNYVAKMPGAVAGSGGHDATIHVAAVLMQGFDLPRGEARQIMDEYNARCAPPWSDKEIEHKLNQADKLPGLQTREGLMPRGSLGQEVPRDDGPREPRLPSEAASAAAPLPPLRKPEFNPEILARFATRWRNHADTAWLADRSPVLPYQPTTGWLPPADYLANVFNEGEKVVVFTNQQSQGQALWPEQAIPERGDKGVWYLSQPVDGEYHVNPRSRTADGGEKTSRRSEESVLDWRHLVLESDEADARDWMGALVQLPLRIVAIYTSGGRSIHALIRVDAPTKGEWDNCAKQLRPALETLGADPKAMTAVRLTRLPGCWRGDRLQKLLYLAPDPAPVPICASPKLRDVVTGLVTAAGLAVEYSVAELSEADRFAVRQMIEGLKWYKTATAARLALGRLMEWRGSE